MYNFYTILFLCFFIYPPFGNLYILYILLFDEYINPLQEYISDWELILWYWIFYSISKNIEYIE
jgi:hypothetical protein